MAKKELLLTEENIQDMTPYQILGIKPGVTDKEIASAYRKISKNYHPDKNKEESAQRIFLKITEAYEKLLKKGKSIQKENSQEQNYPGFPDSWEKSLNEKERGFLDYIRDENVNEIQDLIDMNVDVNMGNGVPLQLAIHKKNIVIIKLLIESGADINAINVEAFYDLVAAGNVEIIKFLIDAGINIKDIANQVYKSYEGSRGITPFGLALVEGNLEIIKLLIESGANVNAIDVVTFDHLIKEDRVEIIKLLIDAGIDIKGLANQVFRTSFGHGTPLNEALDQGNVEIIRLLIENGADVDIRKGYNFNEEIKKGNIEIIKLFIKNGADVNNFISSNNWPLEIAINGRNIEIIKLLIESGADVNVEYVYPGWPCYSPLRAAINVGDIEIIKLLVKSGATQPKDMQAMPEKVIREAYMEAYEEADTKALANLMKNFPYDMMSNKVPEMSRLGSMLKSPEDAKVHATDNAWLALNSTNPELAMQTRQNLLDIGALPSDHKYYAHERPGVPVAAQAALATVVGAGVAYGVKKAKDYIWPKKKEEIESKAQKSHEKFVEKIEKSRSSLDAEKSK